jgi:uncharacterized delta-60 repeat protein
VGAVGAALTISFGVFSLRREAVMKPTQFVLLFHWFVAVFSAAQTPGSFDTTPPPGFGNGTGKLTNLSIGTGNDVVRALALQADGKIVLAGHCDGSGTVDFCIARLNRDGSLDPTFTGPNGNEQSRFKFLVGAGSYSHAYAMTIQPDNKILVAGSCPDGTNEVFCVARLLPNGAFDATFVGPNGSASGTAIVPIGNEYGVAKAMALQADGKITVAGFCWNGITRVFCAARLHANGSLDSSFAGPSNGGGRFLLPLSGGSDEANAILIQADGKILLFGTCSTGSPNYHDFCGVRLNIDGSVDSNFATNGKFQAEVASPSDSAFLNAALLLPNGNIVLGGGCIAPMGSGACLARLRPDGSFDASFGSSYAGSGRRVVDSTFSPDQVLAMSLQTDGRLVLAGRRMSVSTSYFLMARLLPNGNLDTAFQNGAITNVLPMVGTTDIAYSSAIQNDGKILFAGTCLNGTKQDFCVARVNAGESTLTAEGIANCRPDIDGDGVMNPLIDGLIITRAMLGMAGSAVIQGMSFQPHALRKTWAAIRDYLVMQCGLRTY